MPLHNQLSHALKQALEKPELRAQFYRDFMAADIYLVKADAAAVTEFTQAMIDEDQDIQLQHIEANNDWFIPIFSSVASLKDAHETAVTYFKMAARDLMQLTTGVNLFLDYGSEVSKPFLADEVNAILDGTIWQQPRETQLSGNSEVLLGEPTSYPEALAQALLAWLPSQPLIERAWLAMIYNPEDGLPPHTILALDALSDEMHLSQAIGRAIHKMDIPNPPLDILFIGQEPILDAYFLEDTQAFYQRSH